MVCRELSKTHEEVRRGTLAELAAWAAAGPLGEITIVVAGAPPRSAAARAGPEMAAEAAAEVAARERAGTSRKDAIAAVAKERGLPKRAVYDAVVRPGAGSRLPS